jgi:hypothetical protein
MIVDRDNAFEILRRKSYLCGPTAVDAAETEIVDARRRGVKTPPGRML